MLLEHLADAIECKDRLLWKNIRLKVIEKLNVTPDGLIKAETTEGKEVEVLLCDLHFSY